MILDGVLFVRQNRRVLLPTRRLQLPVTRLRSDSRILSDPEAHNHSMKEGPEARENFERETLYGRPIWPSS